ncbi:MAG: NAD(+)/NADH kinase [Solirubrobacterales bacterium]
MSAPIASIELVTHTHPAQTTDAVETVLAAAQKAGCALVAGSEELAKHPSVADRVGALADLDGEPDLCLVLGGDGSILQALRKWSGTDVPVLGINYGTIGFLAAIEREELEPGLERLFARDFDVMELPGLELGMDADPPVALNDVSFTRRAHGRVAELSYSLGGEELGHVRCDGLVAATPAGSTGYNLANSGPILAWGVEGYVVSFISPHTLTARALVAAPSDTLHVSNARGREPVEIALDGQRVGELQSGDDVEIRFRDAVARLAQAPGSSFYRRMRERFGRLAK